MTATISGRMVAMGIWLGLGAAVPIGPVNVEIARRSLRNGFRAGFALGCGAVSVDVLYAILSSVGMASALNRPVVLRPLSVLGPLLLAVLGALSLRAAAHDLRVDPLKDARPPASAHGAYLTGLLMTLLNPMTIAFWFVAVPGWVGSITAAPARDLPMICLGVFLATVSWVTVFSGTLGALGNYRRRWWLAAADSLGGLMLLGFATAGFWRVWRPSL